ncbi:MAG TPA: hypothetical protein ENK06_00145 [Gammaproteobacteria bacterium]|nr:hypothetical protein [Gammaproteobacteria bacterium]
MKKLQLSMTALFAWFLLAIFSSVPAAEVSELFTAAGNGDKQSVEKLLKAGADPDERVPSGATPLIYAAQQGHNIIVGLLIDSGAEVNASVSSNVAVIGGRTALHFAAQNGKNDVVNTLIADGAKVDVRDLAGFTPLILASMVSGDKATISALVSGGANIEARNTDSATALIAAAFKGNEKAFRALLDNGADINATTKYGITPLAMAARNGNKGFVVELIRRGADVNVPNANGDTALDDVTIMQFEKKALDKKSIKRFEAIRLLLLNAGATARRTGLKYGSEYVIGKPKNITSKSLTVVTKEGSRNFLIDSKTQLCANGKSTKDPEFLGNARTVAVLVGLNERVARSINGDGMTIRIQDSELIGEIAGCEKSQGNE